LSDDFDFDDIFEDEDSTESIFEEGNSSSSKPSNKHSEEKKEIIRKCIIAIAIALVLITLSFIVAGRGKDTNKEDMSNIKNEINGNKNDISIVETSNIKEDTYGNGWVEVDSRSSKEINFDENYKDSVFTVRDLKIYVRYNKGINSISVKAIALGELEGFDGVICELVLDYDRWVKLEVGNSFAVKVMVGEYKDRKVIGEVIIS